MDVGREVSTLSERTLRSEELKETGFGGGGGWLILTNKRLVWASKNSVNGGPRWETSLTDIEAATAYRPKGTQGIEEIEIRYRDAHKQTKTKKFAKISVTSFFTLGSASRLEQSVLRPFADAIVAAREAVVAAEPLPAWFSAPVPAAATPPAQPAAPPIVDTIGQLERLAKLRADGALSEEEFTAAKKKLLNL